MNAGDLRHRITLERPRETRTPGGTVTTDWEPIATVWAAIEPLEGSEQLRGMQLEARVTHRIRIRYRAGLPATLRATKRERVFDVRSAIDAKERHEELVFLVDEVSEVSP